MYIHIYIYIHIHTYIFHVELEIHIPNPPHLYSRHGITQVYLFKPQPQTQSMQRRQVEARPSSPSSCWPPPLLRPSAPAMQTPKAELSRILLDYSIFLIHYSIVQYIKPLNLQDVSAATGHNFGLRAKQQRLSLPMPKGNPNLVYAEFGPCICLKSTLWH